MLQMLQRLEELVDRVDVGEPAALDDLEDRRALQQTRRLFGRNHHLLDLGIGYDAYWWGSKYWADFVVADWATAQRSEPRAPGTAAWNSRSPTQS